MARAALAIVTALSFGFAGAAAAQNAPTPINPSTPTGRLAVAGGAPANNSQVAGVTPSQAYPLCSRSVTDRCRQSGGATARSTAVNASTAGLPTHMPTDPAKTKPGVGVVDPQPRIGPLKN